ncbi:hypothetical protein [Burkholderia stagnalis]|uniref:hypothetical protein n=1 Tax=Burkholderia stagnalis TaxID=1503054 RepID=UPI0007548702|nr:hypothetical protein [Burkholderia stagnalis]KWH30638.1 hypothetical protein WT61_01920 [Burkholderia stagnalis]KWH42562.1 hypothetical protein WT62_18585 [Burkholderia stagnalis]
MNEIERALARFAQEMGAVDDMVHALVKGHLLIEEALAKIIDQFVFHREHVAHARLNFATKVHVCRALYLRKNNLGEWELIEALNALRNVVAHTLQSPQRERKFNRVKEIYMREAAGMSGIEEVPDRSEADVVLLACGHSLGFLTSFEGDARAFRQLVFDMDRSMNADLPPFDLLPGVLHRQVTVQILGRAT